jgi:anti-anti-sigma factor
VSQTPFEAVSQGASPGQPVVLRLSGELDEETSPILTRAVEAALTVRSPSGLVLDMAGVGFMDSSGLGCLLKSSEMSDGAGVRMVLRDVPDVLLLVMHITDVLDMFNIEESR